MLHARYKGIKRIVTNLFLKLRNWIKHELILHQEKECYDMIIDKKLVKKNEIAVHHNTNFIPIDWFTFLDLICFRELSSCCSSCWSSFTVSESSCSPNSCLPLGIDRNSESVAVIVNWIRIFLRPCSVNPSTWGLRGIGRDWEGFWLVGDLIPPNPSNPLRFHCNRTRPKQV